MNTIEIAFKYIPIAIEFEKDGQQYIKTNHHRGYQWEDGKKVFRTFKKSVLVKTNNEYFNVVC